MKRALWILLILSAGILEFCTPLCCAQLKADELFAVMRASHNRYVSIEAQMEVRGFYEAEEKQENPALMYSQSIIYRKAGRLVYGEYTTKTFSETGAQDQCFKEIALLSPQGDKYFREDPLGSKHRYGEIRKNRGFSGWMSLTPDIIFWWYLDNPRLEAKHSKFLQENPDKAAITFDQTMQAYILDIPLGIEENAPHYRYTIDPCKGYMPIIQEWLGEDRTLIQKNVCRDYRQVHGFWAPFGYSVYLPNGNRVTDVTIQSVSVNQSISPEKFTFEFPAGTRVSDQLLGINYTVGVKNTEPNQQSPAGASSSAPGQLVPPATDTELAQTALKAEDLLAGEKQTAAQIPPAMVTMVVDPAYVWILPGKNEYVLSVNSNSEKAPVLINHSMETKGLILHDVKNQISSSRKINVVIERPESLKDYTDGVMTLEFDNQKVTVHFIAAPILSE